MALIISREPKRDPVCDAVIGPSRFIRGDVPPEAQGTTKLCPGCGMEKSVAAFNPYAVNRGGLPDRCWTCPQEGLSARQQRLASLLCEEEQLGVVCLRILHGVNSWLADIYSDYLHVLAACRERDPYGLLAVKGSAMRPVAQRHGRSTRRMIGYLHEATDILFAYLSGASLSHLQVCHAAVHARRHMAADGPRYSYSRPRRDRRTLAPDQRRSAASAAQQRRRGRLLFAEGTHTDWQWRALCAFFDNRCLCCGAEGLLTFDHVIPLARQGGNHIFNGQPLCLSCNIRKQAQRTDYRPAGWDKAFAVFLGSYVEQNT